MSAVDPMRSDFVLRDAAMSQDVDAIGEIVSSTGFFSAAEIEVAVELVEDRLARGEASDYHFVFADLAGRTVAYACYGPIACTVGSFDLYWIATHRDFQGHGLGKLLLRAAEERIKQASGRAVYIETSARAQYAPTQAFYERCGYVVEATLKDFYAPGDDKLVYVRKLT